MHDLISWDVFKKIRSFGKIRKTWKALLNVANNICVFLFSFCREWFLLISVSWRSALLSHGWNSSLEYLEAETDDKWRLLKNLNILLNYHKRIYFKGPIGWNVHFTCFSNVFFSYSLQGHKRPQIPLTSHCLFNLLRESNVKKRWEF